ncbi:MAG: carboxymuconolactone decarboxylase family protein [Candidatus Altiarchaeales archaeon]|nr:carboxymuconolactone decarboxylase family protein [Candidatus Altiarchaeales archaeon]
MDSMKDVLDEVDGSLKFLGKQYPNQMKAFGNFMQSAEKEGALSHKNKELISIALSVATHCRWCIAHHVKQALEAGATEDEIMEACFVAALMGGGPSLMYTQLVVKAIKEFDGGER